MSAPTMDPHRFDVALSYATEDRPYVQGVAAVLKERGVDVFYDEYHSVDIWGRDLSVYFDEVYRQQSRFVVVFASAHYLMKAWPRRELQLALAAAILERRELILPARMDNTELPGLPPTIGSVNCQHRTPEQLAEMIIEKIAAVASQRGAAGPVRGPRDIGSDAGEAADPPEAHVRSVVRQGDGPPADQRAPSARQLRTRYPGMIKRPACLRTSTDPLLRLFLDRYGLHLLAAPRENLDVGELYAVRRRRATPIGNIRSYLSPPLRLPRPRRGEVMAGVAETISLPVSLDAGLGILKGLFEAIGAPGLLAGVHATYHGRRVGMLRFGFADSQRDSMDLGVLGKALAGRRVDSTNAAWDRGAKHYLVTAVARAATIVVTALESGGHGVDVDLGPLQVAKVIGDLKVERVGKGTVAYRGASALAFGVELNEVVEAGKPATVKLPAMLETLHVRNPSDRGWNFVGGLSDSAFLDCS
jgi:TIR domain-containing protein